MIVRIRGTLSDVNEESIVIDRDGEAREVLVPPCAIGELAAHRGQQVTLHTMEFYEGNQASGHLVPRMLGFLHPEDRLFFTRLLNVKGLGPRKALRALTEPVRRIAAWIEAGDAQALTRLPGIGKRGAELVVASLRGKMSDLAIGGSSTDGTGAAKLSEAQRDAIEVLVAWGDTRPDAERWIERAGQLQPDVQSADEWVRVAYRIKTGAAG